eukprot:2594247-Rhodomonas_salina.1
MPATTFFFNFADLKTSCVRFDAACVRSFSRSLSESEFAEEEHKVVGWHLVAEYAMSVPDSA